MFKSECLLHFITHSKRTNKEIKGFQSIQDDFSSEPVGGLRLYLSLCGIIQPASVVIILYRFFQQLGQYVRYPIEKDSPRSIVTAVTGIFEIIPIPVTGIPGIVKRSSELTRMNPVPQEGSVPIEQRGVVSLGARLCDDVVISMQNLQSSPALSGEPVFQSRHPEN
ncbi:MAG: hypothetical protein HUJ26_17630 [Planctomycetaceae bacterium]|nr:hypothetical protein [Planctomycetaceae bacterium]